MSFSARQQHCLEAMGIVPWVSKSESLIPMVEPITAVPEISAAPIQQAVVRIAAPVETLAPANVIERPAFVLGPMPESVEELALWLPSQPLGLLAVRSVYQNFVGQPEAPLLIVVDSKKSKDSDQPPAASPFNSEAAQLFDLMMRAINVTLGQRKLCHLSRRIDPASATEPGVVVDLCVPQTKAVLLLVQDWNSFTAPITDHFRLDQPPLPVWRIPHPNLLLEFNQLKRQAWRSLQALQSVLS
ncbi:MAG: hypothetical protein ACI9UN_001625 [Granulosicoccus sp.]